uniref:Uncharacterized protein n=1 Tax=Ixodes ricinus TaxID=34613 RepID=A0A6B0UEI1_IXORI
MISGGLHSWLGSVFYFASLFALLYVLEIVFVSFASTIFEGNARIVFTLIVVTWNSCSAWSRVHIFKTLPRPLYYVRSAAGQKGNTHHESEMHCCV